MGLFDRLLGRGTPPPPDLDRLFAVPAAALTLQTTVGFHPTGTGSVCFRAAEGAEFSRLEQEIRALLDADEGPDAEVTRDEFGYRWLVLRHAPDDLAGLVTDLHAVNATLSDDGFGPMLLCSLVGFAAPGGRSLGLVYLYKRGSFYPFAPTGPQARDSTVELQVRAALDGELPLEGDLSRWFPVWGAPGL